ncbi:MAG TPA: tetratricopeptide repeat protein [Bacteroidales bacterium]|nr:tetratricopeptide repeat protein [Bacteroidales bacterium]
MSLKNTFPLSPIRICVLFCTLFLILWVVNPLCAQNNPDEKLAIQFYQNGEYEKAKELFQKIYDKKQDTYIYFYYYRTLLELQEYKDLERVVKKQQKAYPTLQRYKIDLGYVYEISGKNKDAYEVYDEAIKKVPNTENAYRELYNAFLAFGKRDYAEIVLMKARKQLQNNKLFSRELTMIYQQLNLTDKIFNEALNLIQDDDVTYLVPAQEILQNLLIDDPDNQKHHTIKNGLKKAIQNNPNNSCYLKLYYWICILNKDFSEGLQIAKAIDRRSKNSGDILLDFALIAKENRAYDLAIDALNAIIERKLDLPISTSAQFELLNVKYLRLTSISPVKLQDAQALELEFKKMIDEYGIHSGTSDWIRKYAHLMAFYSNKPDEASIILNKAITNAENDKRVIATYKIDLADILLHTNQIWDATLLYSQVDKDFPNDTIGQVAKFKNAKLSFYIGEFAWAQSQLDVLRAATSKLISNDAMYLSFIISDNQEDEEESDEEDTLNTLFNDNTTHNIALRMFAKADFLIFQNNDNEALKYLDSITIYSPLSPLTDDVLYTRAQIATRQKDFFAAEKYYKKILEYYSTDILGDDALFKLAELYEYYLTNIPEAMACYQKLLKEYPGSLYVVDARKRFRYLRGDNLD